MTKGNTSKPGTHGQNSIKGLNIRINMLKKEYTLIKGKRSERNQRKAENSNGRMQKEMKGYQHLRKVKNTKMK
jgi:hypothetical protein